jgi:hypothetical protein
MRLHASQTASGCPITVDGHAVLGTYVAQDIAALEQVKAVGMNVVIGNLVDLDPESETGKFCLDNGIKILYHMTKHVYGKPTLRDRVDAKQTTLPLVNIGKELSPESNDDVISESGVILLDDELIRYETQTNTELLGCSRGHDGTVPAEHRCGMTLLFPDECAADVESVKNSPNLWGYYTLDDSPGDAISNLRGIYRTIKRLDGDSHPVLAGYGSAGALHNFGPEVCDAMLFYWYPNSDTGHDRYLTSEEVQWMLATARSTVPGISFIGVYQAFDGGVETDALPSADELRQQIEDFVREGACGLIAFLCSHKGANGWANHGYMQQVLADVHSEIRSTGGLTLSPESGDMKERRVQPAGHWDTPTDVPGVVPAWHVIAPFDVDGQMLDAKLPPDDVIDLEGVYDGKSGPIRWIRRSTCGGVLGLGELFGPHTYTSGCIAYATCTVLNSNERKVRIYICTDDDGIVYLNGEQVFRHEGQRGIKRDADMVEVTLPAGESQLLVKDYNRKGMWGIFLRFADTDGKPLEGLRFSPETGE